MPSSFLSRTCLCLSCCALIGSPTGIGDDSVPVTPNASVAAEKVRITVFRDQRYSSVEGSAGLCDVYSPVSLRPKSGYGVVIAIHGGGWMSGDKWMQERYCRALARAGLVAVSINYRLAPAYRFPAQVDDVRQALIWTSENAERFSIDIDRLGMLGYSAGGHLSTLVGSLADEPMEVRTAASAWPASDLRWKQLPTIRAVCAGGPPCDFRSLPIDNHSLAFFLGGSRREKPEVYVSASPASHVSASDPPTQIIHGDSDLIVPIAGSRRLHQAQVAVGIDSRLEVMSSQGHMVTFVNPKTVGKVVEFFREVLVETRPGLESNDVDQSLRSQ